MIFRKKTWLLISAPPKITAFSFARDLNVGDRSSIQCLVATGDLPLTFTWLKDNVAIESAPEAALGASSVGGPKKALNEQTSRPGEHGRSPNKAITIHQYNPFNSVLSISHIAPAHKGTYTCRVANGAGTVAHSALLHVNGNDPRAFLAISIFFLLSFFLSLPFVNPTKRSGFFLFYFFIFLPWLTIASLSQ